MLGFNIGNNMKYMYRFLFMYLQVYIIYNLCVYSGLYYKYLYYDFIIGLVVMGMIIGEKNI